MTILIMLGVLFALMLGFSFSGLIVSSKLACYGKAVQGVIFILLGSGISVFVMALMVFIVWPTHLVI